MPSAIIEYSPIIEKLRKSMKLVDTQSPFFLSKTVVPVVVVDASEKAFRLSELSGTYHIDNTGWRTIPELVVPVGEVWHVLAWGGVGGADADIHKAAIGDIDVYYVSGGGTADFYAFFDGLPIDSVTGAVWRIYANRVEPAHQDLDWTVIFRREV